MKARIILNEIKRGEGLDSIDIGRYKVLKAYDWIRHEWPRLIQDIHARESHLRTFDSTELPRWQSYAVNIATKELECEAEDLLILQTFMTMPDGTTNPPSIDSNMCKKFLRTLFNGSRTPIDDQPNFEKPNNDLYDEYSYQTNVEWRVIRLINEYVISTNATRFIESTYFIQYK